VDQLGQMAELGAAMRRVAAGQHLGYRAPGQTKPIENPSHDTGCGTDGLFLKAFGNLLGGQIRPQNVLAHGITGGAVLDRLLHLVGQVRVFDFRLFASTSRLADATSGRIRGELLEFPHAVFDGLGIASQDLGDVAGAAMAEFDRFECRKASAILGSYLRRDNVVSVLYSEGLNSTKSSVFLQRTDRHGIVGQKSSDFQRFL
jgi:hypothetical protein